MSITVEEALKTEGLKKARLVAGKSGLKKEIHCIDTMEVPDIKPWLQKNEFLMTTGYSIRDRENGLLNLLKYLHEREAAGLAITTEFVGEFSEEEKMLADRLAIPLVEIPSDIPFAQMTNPLMKAIVDKQNEMLEFSNSMNKQFVDLEINGGGFSDIASVLYNLTGYGVIIANLRWEVLAYAQNGEGMPVESLFQEKRQGMLLLAESERYAVMEDEKEILMELGGKTVKMIRMTVLVRRKAIGYVLMICQAEEEVSNLKIIAMHHASVSAALEFSKIRTIANNQQLLDNNFLWDLLSGNIQNEEEAYHRGKALKWSIPYRLLSFDIRRFEEWSKGYSEIEIQEMKEETASFIERQLAARGIGSSVAVKSDIFICIVSAEYGKETLRSAAEKITEETGRQTGFSFTVGISSVYSSYLQIKDAFDECSDAVRISRMHKNGEAVCIEDVLLERTLMLMGKNDYFKLYIEQILGKLLEYDGKNGGDLLETLEALVDNMGARNDTAKSLFLHRNTLAYRINKIEALTGFELDNNKNLFMIGLALKMRYFL